jgi:UDP-N-acetylglucosamine 2-epimerase (non-hydrolysing)
MNKKLILTVVGTRPEAIKMAPVIWELKKANWAECQVINTAQHREMVDQILESFDIKPELDLDIMSDNQSLVYLTSKLINKIDKIMSKIKPDYVLAQGDTSTVYCVALVCFYRKIPFGHIEAGLRTYDKYYPFPEEMNRVLITRLADDHFAPTEKAKENLLREGISERNIHVTGNTVIDILLKSIQRKGSDSLPSNEKQKLILVTAHRREIFGQKLQDICLALKEIADREKDIVIVYPVHLNPNVKNRAEKVLNDHSRIKLIEPLDYHSFVKIMNKAYLILTDSGGILEEAPALGKPVLVLRNETERPEAVNTGVVKVIGTDRKTIIEETMKLIRDKSAYEDMARCAFPYGKGDASLKIIKVLEKKWK